LEEALGGFTLSVVVPVHNGSTTLPHVLAVLREELLPGDELIVSDDGSTDGSGELAASFSALLVTPEVRGGAAAARNAGAAAATAEWLLFIDSDAVAPSGWRGMLAARIASGFDAVQAVYGREAAGCSPSTFYKNYYYHYTFTRRIHGPCITGCGTFFFAVRRKIFQELAGFDERIRGASIEDADFAERLTASGGRIALAPEIEVLHLREYTFLELMRYDWKMIRAKALYMLRRDRTLGRPSVSMASPGEMLPVITGAFSVWGMLAGLAAGLAGWAPGWVLSALSLAVVVAGHAGFWTASVRQGGSRGLAAGVLVFPDLLLIVPAFLSASLSALAGKRY
jgi:glycosyltransferase involved in cell wall biosynthesis